MSRSPASPAAAVMLAVLCAGGPARGQISAWLDFEGAIKGEATDERHRDWIVIQGFTIGASRTMSSGPGLPEPERSPPALAELALTKPLDQASALLFEATVAKAEPFPKVTLDLTRNGEPPFARLELHDVLLTGQSFAATAGDSQPAEKISLNFTKITFIHVMPDGDSKYTTYDTARNTATSGVIPAGGTDGDIDDDGMQDDWETANGLNVGGNDAGGDLDGDGLSNLDEYQLGTDPRSGTSFFKATLSAAPSTPGSYQLSWNSVPGKTYVIEWSPDLKTPFSAVRSVTASSSTTTESVTREGNLGFYRVRPQ